MSPSRRRSKRAGGSTMSWRGDGRLPAAGDGGRGAQRARSRPETNAPEALNPDKRAPSLRGRRERHRTAHAVRRPRARRPAREPAHGRPRGDAVTERSARSLRARGVGRRRRGRRSRERPRPGPDRRRHRRHRGDGGTRRGPEHAGMGRGQAREPAERPRPASPVPARTGRRAAARQRPQGPRPPRPGAPASRLRRPGVRVSTRRGPVPPSRHLAGDVLGPSTAPGGRFPPAPDRAGSRRSSSNIWERRVSCRRPS